MSWIELPTGRFEMGAGPDLLPEEGPSRQVSVGSMWLSPLITKAEFRVFVEDHGYRTTAEEAGSGFTVSDGVVVDVVGASWHSSESTVGPAARNGETGPVRQVSWFDAVEFGRWCGTRLPTEAEWEYAATLAAIGNDGVGEWCADWFDAIHHRSEQRVNPTGPKSGLERVVRGGTTRLTQRSSELPDFSSDRIGFRVVALMPIRSGGFDRLGDLWTSRGEVVEKGT